MPLQNAAAYTLGCKVNQYDTDALLDRLTAQGFLLKGFDEPADLYIINTCTVTHVSDRKSRQMIRRARRQNPKAYVAVCGCLAKLSPAQIREAGADFVFDARSPEDFLTVLADSGLSPATGATEFPLRRTRAHIKIQEGCDRFCAYCIVPYARGPVVSRPPEDIVKEAEALLLKGVKEIVLTGIHVAAYGKDYKQDKRYGGIQLPGLLETVAGLAGLARLRLGSIEPYAADDAFIKMLRRLPCLCDHFHLSLQSGCDRTLRRMNRRYTSAQYREAAYRIREALPDAALTTDIIVGFPGESDADFEESLDFVRSMGFLRTHVFEYSARAGTPAARFEEQVPPQVKAARSKAMRGLAEEMTADFLSAWIGREVPVLFETQTCGLWEGHTDNYMTVRVKRCENLLNRIAPVYLQQAAAGVLYGELR